MKPLARIFTILNITLICAVAHAQRSTEVVYIKLDVDGLSCPFCAYGLEKKLKKIPGSTDININIKEGFVTLIVPAEIKPSEEVLIKVVREAGFTPRAIQFSEKPFADMP